MTSWPCLWLVRDSGPAGLLDDERVPELAQQLRQERVVHEGGEPRHQDEDGT
jgi:hypothetical protein